VCLRLPLSEALVRPLDVPKAALEDVKRIAALDLERATPFRIADVHTAVLIDQTRRGGPTVAAEQIIVKRAKLAAAHARLKAAGADIVAADCYRDDPSVALSVNLLENAENKPPTRAALLPSNAVMVATAGVLAVIALAVTTLRHEQALIELREQSSAIRTRIADERGQVGTDDAALVTALARFKGEQPPLVYLLEDLTQRIPDTAYVTELRFADRTLDLSGYGRPVTSLAPNLERSPLIEGASITAPIVTDDERQKERFSLRLRLGEDRAEQSTGPPPAPSVTPPAPETTP
jgi:general secretion pathway protein L